MSRSRSIPRGRTADRRRASRSRSIPKDWVAGGPRGCAAATTATITATSGCALRPSSPGSAAGRIDNGWGDDQDFFVFEIDATRTLSVAISGEIATTAALYDSHGQRLAVPESGGLDEELRLVKTLTPGLYFLRLESGDRRSGAYALTVEPLRRSW